MLMFAWMFLQGKGKIVVLASKIRFRVVGLEEIIGHTVYLDDNKYKTHLIPSGYFME